MSHGIETLRDFQTGIAMEWHKKTKVVDQVFRYMFPEIQKVQSAIILPDGSVKILTDRHTPISLDDNLPCGEDLASLFTPHKAWDLVHELLAGTGFKVESIGMIKNRSKWFISTSLDELQQVKADNVKINLNFSGGLDGCLAPQADLNGIRIVCANTLAFSRATGKPLFRAKQTLNFFKTLEDRKAEISAAVGQVKVIDEKIKRMQDTPCALAEAKSVFLALLNPPGAKEISTRTDNQVEELAGLFAHGDGNHGETRYDALNAVTQLYTRGSVNDKSKKNVWSQYESSEFGAFADRKAGFFAMATDDKAWEKSLLTGEQLFAGLLAKSNHVASPTSTNLDGGALLANLLAK